MHFIVFEFIEGVNIAIWSRARAPVAGRSNKLHAASGQGTGPRRPQRNVMHRDIKPSNLLITPTARPS